MPTLVIYAYDTTGKVIHSSRVVEIKTNTMGSISAGELNQTAARLVEEARQAAKAYRDGLLRR